MGSFTQTEFELIEFRTVHRAVPGPGELGPIIPAPGISVYAPNPGRYILSATVAPLASDPLVAGGGATTVLGALYDSAGTPLSNFMRAISIGQINTFGHGAPFSPNPGAIDGWAGIYIGRPADGSTAVRDLRLRADAGTVIGTLLWKLVALRNM